MSQTRLLAIDKPGSNVVGFIERNNENSSVADLTGSCRFDNDLHDIIDSIVFDSDFEHCLWQKVISVFRSSVSHGASPLPSKSSSL